MAFDSEESAISWLVAEGYGNWRGRGQVGEGSEELWWHPSGGSPLELRRVPLWDSARVVAHGQALMR